VGGLIGALYAVLFNRLGMPSFVANALGPAGDSRAAALRARQQRSINLPYGSAMVDFGS